MDFGAIQKRFFNKLMGCSSPTEVTISYLTVEHKNTLDSFLGDGKRTVDKSFKLKCFYQRYTNDKQREKSGVAEDVTFSIYISPLELSAKTGSSDFPKHVRKAYSKIKLEFLGELRDIESIVDLEPIQLRGELTRIAYKINLRGEKDLSID